MATTIGEFLFALGFAPPDMKPLQRASAAAQRSLNEAQQKVADGAEDASDAIAAAGKKIDAVARKNAKTISGIDTALEAVAKGARKSAREFFAAWSDSDKLGEAWKTAITDARNAAIGIAGAATAAAAGVGAIVHSTAESDAQLVRWSTRLGTSVRELSRLEQAAAQVNGEDGIDALREGVQTLRENLGELATQGSGPALESLRTLGLSLSDFEGKDAGAQLATLADALGRVPNDAGMQAILELLGGGDGAKLLPLLREGSAGMAALADEAERLGLVVDDEAAKGSAAFAKELGQVVAMVKAVAASVARELMPVAREYIGIAKAWIAENRELVRTKLREYIEELIPKLISFVETIYKIVTAAASLAQALGGMENALTVAGVGFAALRVAALGIPGVMIAAAAAIAAGIVQLGGYSDELERIRKQADELDARQRRMVTGTAALEELEKLASSGRLAELSDEEFESLSARARSASAVELGGAENVRGLARVRQEKATNRNLRFLEEQRGKQIVAAETATEREKASNGSLRDKARKALAARNKSKRLGLGESGVDTALATFQQTYRETGSVDAAADAAADKLDSLAGSGKSGGAKKIDTSTADELFGDEIRRLATREGVGAAGVRSSLEAAAGSLKEGAAKDVARAAALGRLGGLAGKDLSPAKGKDPLLSEIFGKDVPDVELSAIARGAQPQVLISNITNTLNLEAPITVNGAGDPVVVGQAAASALKSEFKLALSQASRTVKPVFAR
jgi:hypothetical protein